MTLLELGQHPQQVLGPREAQKPPLDGTTLLARLDGSPELAQFLADVEAGPRRVLLMVNDPHRSTCTREVLVALADVCGRRHAGLAFRVIVATGTHRIGTDERDQFERATFADCGLSIGEVAWHDALDPKLQPFCGGRVHPWLAEDEAWLAIGSVEPHYFAGLTGAHKTATIGCISRADIERNHAGALHPGSDVFRLAGNPVHEGIVAWLDSFRRNGKRVLGINELVREGQMLAVAVGDPLATLEDLLHAVRETYSHAIAEPVDLLRLEVPMPLGRSLYQADKALKNNHRAVRDGGAILLEAECPEGVGDEAFLRLLGRAPDYASACRAVELEGYRLGDHKAVKLRHLMDPAARGVHVALVSRCLADEVARRAGLRSFPTRTEALEWLDTAVEGSRRRALAVRDAGFVVVVPEG